MSFGPPIEKARARAHPSTWHIWHYLLGTRALPRKTQEYYDELDVILKAHILNPDFGVSIDDIVGEQPMVSRLLLGRPQDTW